MPPLVVEIDTHPRSNLSAIDEHDEGCASVADRRYRNLSTCPAKGGCVQAPAAYPSWPSRLPTAAYRTVDERETTVGSHSSNKRTREIARAKAERQRTRRSEQSRRSRRTVQIVSAVVALAVIAAVVWFAVIRPSGSDTANPSPMPTEPLAPSTQPAPDNPISDPAPVIDGCTEAPALRPNDILFPDGPLQVIDTAKPTTFTFTTNCGPIVIEADSAAAPETVNAMAFLTEEGYFDLTACHRLTTEGIFVLQCGDPAGNGSGGPGFVSPDENLPTEGPVFYPAGSVAMANAGSGTAGSQFFIVYEDSTNLSPSYTLWGTVTQGLDRVQAVAAAGTTTGAPDGPPRQPVVIEQATVVN